jgi:hypothetical protein
MGAKQMRRLSADLRITFESDAECVRSPHRTISVMVESVEA